MSKAYPPKVVTAHDLRLGDVVYLSPEGAWVRAHSQAALFTDAESADAALAGAAKQGLVIVGAYLADAVMGATGPEPVHFREKFRTLGPSNYPHGKQEEAL